MEEIIKGIITFFGIVYEACKLAMPFIVIDIYNKVKEIEQNSK